MKSALLTIALTILLTSLTAACSLFTPKNVRTVLNVTEMACVIALEFNDIPEEVAHACHIADDMIPEVEKLLQARKAAAKMKASPPPSACPSTSTTK